MAAKESFQINPRPANIEYRNLSVRPNPALTNGEVTVNATVANLGDKPGEFAAKLQIDANVYQSTSGTLQGGETRHVSFTLAPGTLGAGNHTVTVTGAGPAQLQIEEAAPRLETNRTAIDYGEVQATPTVEATKTRHVRITNNGTATLDIGSIGLTGAAVDQFEITTGDAPTSLAPNESTVVGVTYQPTERGDATAHLEIQSNDAGSPATLTLAGTGVAPALDLKTPGPLDVGTVDAGKGETNTTQITVANAGNKSLTVSAAISQSLSATPDAFTITSDADQQLGAGESATITVEFAPSTGGRKSAAVRLTTNDPFDANRTVRIGGTAQVVSLGVSQA
ncbi:MAG: choice-of-anchor D domain-containing protein, partial [Halobaculum sp.]